MELLANRLDWINRRVKGAYDPAVDPVRAEMGMDASLKNRPVGTDAVDAASHPPSGRPIISA